jgi:hypothetical protein
MKTAHLVERYGAWAVVTGASSGIGAEFARQLAAEGMNLFLVARREDRLAALAEELERDHGIETGYVRLDVTAPDAAEALAVATAGLDVGLVVNNSGGGRPGTFVRSTSADQLDITDLNFRAPTAITHAFLDRLRSREHSGIVFVSSIIGYGSAPYIGIYGASKAAIRQFGYALGRELEGDGVDVLVLSPGPTRTELADGLMGDKSDRAMDPARVIREALRGRGRKREVVPGLFNKAMVGTTSRLLPSAVAATMNARFVETMLPDLVGEPAAV